MGFLSISTFSLWLNTYIRTFVTFIFYSMLFYLFKISPLLFHVFFSLNFCETAKLIIRLIYKWLIFHGENNLPFTFPNVLLSKTVSGIFTFLVQRFICDKRLWKSIKMWGQINFICKWVSRKFEKKIKREKRGEMCAVSVIISFIQFTAMCWNIT